MAKRVFFSFHYDDVKSFRANVVRNHWVTKDRDDAGFFDASIWEDAELHGDESVKKLIRDGLENTSVSVVLIGSETCNRRWVRYEIVSSMARGNKMFGVHINGIKDRDSNTRAHGQDPFAYLARKYSADGTTLSLYEWSGKEWVPYSDYPEYKLQTPRPKSDWGKFEQLSIGRRVYDWVAENGYEKFADWVGT